MALFYFKGYLKFLIFTALDLDLFGGKGGMEIQTTRRATT